MSTRDHTQGDGLYPVVVNRPQTSWGLPDLREIWQYRSLLLRMTISELKARYKQTVLGVLWAIISPLITMVVLTFVFRGLAQVESYDIPYPIFSFSGLAVWYLFSRGFAASSTSVVMNATLIGKVYFPRIFAPLAKLFVGLVDFLIALVILFLMMLYFGYWPRLESLTIIFFTLLALMSALGIGLWLSALHVRFRDIGQIVPFMVQTLFYLTPVAYPSSLLTEPWRTLYGLNPMVTVCDGYRWALLGVDSFHGPTAVVSTLVAVVLLVSGLVFFRRMEATFPDLI